MKKKSLKRISVLGLVLLIASAVTAAILPNQSNNKEFINSADNATLISNSGLTPGASGIRSCVPDNAGDAYFTCHLSSATVTGSASEGILVVTVGNTSNSWNISPGDTTSLEDTF